MYCAHSLIHVAACHGMSNLGFHPHLVLHSSMRVYYEIYEDIETAINREKQIKSWPRRRKIALINSLNPFWNDYLFEKLSK